MGACDGQIAFQPNKGCKVRRKSSKSGNCRNELRREGAVEKEGTRARGRKKTMWKEVLS